MDFGNWLLSAEDVFNSIEKMCGLQKEGDMDLNPMDGLKEDSLIL